MLTLEAGRRLFRNLRLFRMIREPLISWDAADYGIDPQCVERLIIETRDGQSLEGWYCRARDPIASALYFYGNTGNLTNTAHVVPHFLAAGINVLTFDYRGYGRSTGRPTLTGVVKDGLAAAQLHDAIRPPELPSMAYGFSLGGAIAAQVVRSHSFDGLVLQSTFTDFPSITRFSFPGLPFHFISGNPFNTIAVVGDLDIPLLLIHGTDDETVPHQMGRTLFEACRSRKRIHEIEGGLHKDLFERDAEGIVRQIHRFALELADPAPRKHRVAQKTGWWPQAASAVGALRRKVRRLIASPIAVLTSGSPLRR